MIIDGTDTTRRNALKIKTFDWRSLQRYFSPQASQDLNVFLEKMPQNVGQTVLIAAGAAWAIAGATGLFAAVQAQKLTALRAEFKETSALKPIVPTISDAAVSPAELKSFVGVLTATYPDLTITQQGSSVLISGKSTVNFGQFREALGHVQNGGSGWRVSVDKLCVGRECDRDNLAALLKINKVSVNNPVKN